MLGPMVTGIFGLVWALVMAKMAFHDRTTMGWMFVFMAGSLLCSFTSAIGFMGVIEYA